MSLASRAVHTEYGKWVRTVTFAISCSALAASAATSPSSSACEPSMPHAYSGNTFMHPYEMRALQLPNLGQLHACCAVPRTLLCDAPCCMTSVACCTAFRAFATDRVTCALNIVSHAKPVCAWKSEVMLPICTHQRVNHEGSAWHCHALDTAVSHSCAHMPTTVTASCSKARHAFAEPPYMVQDQRGLYSDTAGLVQAKAGLLTADAALCIAPPPG